ncbi:MAG TPA: glycosyltransferase family 39 protein [Anaerolineae bacterium]|nr:glycosyltransferase family 39 protein [Anaerolineae bacterium]HQJ50302.1 glycosyltransferase family 39 protein [Anaerolineae bacterium]
MNKPARSTRTEVDNRLTPLSRATQSLERWFPLMLGLVAVLLLCLRLDDVYLWQDEAETALIARHMLAYGLPLSTDGRTWIQQEEVPFHEFSSDYVWIYHPWMQYAATALSFAVLGESTSSARLPFALAGVACILLLYRLARRSQPDPGVARLAAILLALFVPTILLARQCRYYAISAALTLLVLDSYLSLGSARQWSVPCFVLSSVLLFHTEYAAFFPVMAAVAAHALLFQRHSGRWKNLLPALVLIVLLILPWALLIPVWHPVVGSGTTAQPGSSAGLARVALRTIGLIGEQSLQITAWILPLLLLPAVAAGIRANHRRDNPSSPGTGLWSLVVLLIVIHILALSLVGWSFFRYLAHLIPLLLLLAAVGLAWLLHRCKLLGYAALLVLLTTNLLHILPYRAVATAIPPANPFWTTVQSSLATRWIGGIRALKLRSEPLMYAQELTHPYSGPTEGLVAYLAANAKPGQTVLTNYEDLPLQFYTRLTVYGGMSGRGLGQVEPDWVIDRQFGHYREQIAALVASGPYERITIPYPDLRWENREEPTKHQYLTDTTANPVVLYRRTDRGTPGRLDAVQEPPGQDR